jgi:hypothetical protein
LLKLWRKFNRQHASVGSAINCLVQKFELTNGVHKKKKGVVGRYSSANMQDGFAHVCKVLLQTVCNMKFPVIQYQKNIDTIMQWAMTYPYKST